MLAQISSISADWLFGVPIFDFNYIKQFSINFRISCDYLVANFLSFLKHPQLFEFAWFCRKLRGLKPRKSEIRKYANLSQF